MNCHDIANTLDDFLDGMLLPEKAAQVQEHLRHCAACSARLARERELRRALRALPVEGPSEGFYERALAHAMAHDRRRPHFMVGTAVAAGLAMLVVGSLVFQPEGERAGNAIQTASLPQPAANAESTQADAIPGLTISLNETRDVKLVFNASQALAKATFTVVLPPGVELRGYPEQREITWEGSLREGKNLLVLPLVARNTGSGELLATVSHDGKRKVFRLKMAVEQRQGSLPAFPHTLS